MNGIINSHDNGNEDNLAITESGSNNEKIYSVVLPCDTKDFTKFISSLLGKPQELRGSIEGVFKITPQEIVNIYHLLQQRISKQNKSTPINFKITVYYDDGHSVEHNNINDFRNYHPISKCVATGIIISATYLIKFEDAEIAEKQDIEVIFATTPDWTSDYRYSSWFRGGVFQFKIKYTERTWAEDISGLLKKHGESIVKKQTGIKRWIISNIDDCTEYFLCFIAAAFLIYTSNSLIDNIQNINSDQIGIFFIETIKAVTIFFFLCMSFFIINKILQNTPYIGEKSAILITQYDIDKQVEIKNNRTMNLLKYASGWTSGVIIGIISNIIYSKNLFW